MAHPTDFVVACPGCKASYQVPVSLAGKAVTCEACNEDFCLPTGPAAPSPVLTTAPKTAPVPKPPVAKTPPQKPGAKSESKPNAGPPKGSGITAPLPEMAPPAAEASSVPAAAPPAPSDAVAGAGSGFLKNGLLVLLGAGLVVGVAQLVKKDPSKPDGKAGITQPAATTTANEPVAVADPPGLARESPSTPSRAMPETTSVSPGEIPIPLPFPPAAAPESSSAAPAVPASRMAEAPVPAEPSSAEATVPAPDPDPLATVPGPPPRPAMEPEATVPQIVLPTAAPTAPPPLPLPVPDGPPQTPPKAEDEASIRRDSRKTLEHFLLAKTLEERLAFSQHPGKIREAMQGHPAGPFPLEGFTFLTEGQVQDTPLIFHLYNVLLKDQDAPIPVAVEQTKDGYRVDWLTFIESYTHKLRAFCATPSDKPGTFRVLLRRSHYFGPKVPGQDEIRLSFTVESPSRDDTFTVWVDKDSNLYLQKFANSERANWETESYVIVQLQWRGDEQRGRWIGLQNIVSESWRAD